MFRAKGLSSDCHWEFMFNVQLQIPMAVTEPFGFELFLVHVKTCGIVHTNMNIGTVTQSWCQMIRIILEIVINLSLKLTSLVVLAGF